MVDAVLLGGVSEEEAARIFDQPISNVRRWVRAAEDALPLEGDPIPLERLGREARAALSDFGLFSRRYFGRIHMPWQVEAANTVVERLVSPRREFGVINAPPAVGKTTVFAHDIPAWLTCRDRAMRGLLGHRAAKTAGKYVNRLRRTLARPGMFVPQGSEVDAGRALAPVGSLVRDYGRFKPLARELWRADEFVVEQLGEASIIEKESTWTSYGMDSDSIGNRFQFINWDDPMTVRMLRSPAMVQDQRDWWVAEAEERLEPGGLLLVVMQRLGPSDLSRFCLDMEVLVDAVADVDGDAEMFVVEPTFEKRYFHVRFQAHDETRCKQQHGKGALPQPDGCLLDPVRLPWRDITAKQQRNDGTYEVVLQQLDVAPHEMLVRKPWLWGGPDDDGSECVGCFDRDRAYGAPPRTEAPLLSYVTVDPSRAGFWSLFHCLHDFDRGITWVVQMEKRKLQINEVLTWARADRMGYTGLLEKFRSDAAAMGHPVTHVVLEINAMNQWAMQADIWKEWERDHNIVTVQHTTTGLNKADPDRGVEAMCSKFRFGKIRLPGATRRDELLMRNFTDELTTATASNGTGRSAGDAMMSFWFGDHNLENMGRRRRRGGDSGPKKSGLPWSPMGWKRTA